MSVFSLGLMLTAVTVAEPINPQTWVTPSDYPSDPLRQDQGGNVGFLLLISPEGEPVRCEITHPTGYDVLDRFTCQLLMRRAHFKPARDASGHAAWAEYRNAIRWWVEGVKIRTTPPDLGLMVKPFPHGLPSPATVVIAFTVDSSGAMSNCTPIPSRSFPAGSSQAATEQRAADLLGDTACEQAKANFKLPPVLDNIGNAVAYVRTAKVQFITEAIIEQ